MNNGKERVKLSKVIQKMNLVNLTPQIDVNVEGNYGYEYLDCYFEEENRYPYFIKVDGKLAGFAIT